ncbi:MAG: lactate utilization protein C, partial [Kingella sp. (in: b-proteobacteria)]
AIVLALLGALLYWKRNGEYVVRKRALNTSLLCMLMLMIGYSTYAVIVIRSVANPPMDQNSPEEPRSQSLVPPVHFCLFDTQKIYDTFYAAMTQEQLANNMPTNVILISGPSKTADIQLTLAYGAHGPRDLVVLAMLPENINPSDLEDAS